MTVAAYALVVLSAAAHAYWNYLLKRSGAGQTIVGLSKVVESIGLLALLLAGVAAEPGQLIVLWPLPAVGAVLVLANYALLSRAYRHGDLSFVYPLSRGAMLVFLPPIAFLALRERIDAIGWIAIGLIVIGIGALHASGAPTSPASVSSLRTPATAYAVLAALTAACYTVWDKRAVQMLSPLTYFAGYTVLVGLAYTLTLALTTSRGGIRDGWQAHRGVIVQVALLNSGSYLLALAALQTGKASYVIALRQLSIAGGAVLGWRLLGEPLPPARRAGIAMIAVGCVLLTLAR